MGEKEITSVCAFCYKPTPTPNSAGKTPEKNQVLRGFLTIFERYLGEEPTQDLDLTVVNSCQECSLLLESFSELYHQIKCLELRAEWKIRQLRDLVTTADQAQTRVEHFQSCFKGDVETFGNVGQFRKRIIRGCDKHLSKALPRVFISRAKLEDDRVDENSTPIHATLSPPLNLDVCSDLVQQNASNLDSIELKLVEKFDVQEHPIFEDAFETNFEVNLICSICSKSFESLLKLTNHSSSCHNLESSESNPSCKTKRKRAIIPLSKLKKLQRFSCTTCSQKFPTISRLRKHQRGFFHLTSKFRRANKIGNTLKNNEHATRTNSSAITTCSTVKLEENSVTIGILRPLKKDNLQKFQKEEQSDSESSFGNDDDSDISFDGVRSGGNCSSCGKPFKYGGCLSKHEQKCQLSKSKRRKKPEQPRTRPITLKKKRASKLPRPYKCKVSSCGLNFQLKEHLENHSKLHGRFPCSFCTIEEDYAPNLAIHEASVHSAGKKAKPRKWKPNKVPPRTNKRVPRKDYVCPRCDFSAYSMTIYLNHHLETHLGLSRKTVKCPVCSARFVNDKYGYHMKTFHDINGIDPHKVSRCDQCPAYFRRGFQLSIHKQKAHGIHPLRCKDCGKKISTTPFLRNHRQKVHKAEFTFVCVVPNCERRFETHNELEVHNLRLHCGKGEDTSVICSKCGKRFVELSRLLYHMVVHDEEHERKVKARRNERKFVCEKCGKKFRDRTILARHYLFHEGPKSWQFSCLFCDKKCFAKQKLWDHLRTHTREKPFPCNVCGEEYAHAHNLRNHMNKQHAANVQPRKYSALQLESKNWRKFRN